MYTFDSINSPAFLDSLKPYRKIVLFGYTKTGKVKIAKTISEHLGIKLIKTDDFQHIDFKQAVYTMLNLLTSLETTGTPFIIEGVQCARILRKGQETGTFTPDLVIRTECNEQTIRHCYIQDGEGDKLKGALSFNKGIEGIYNQYLDSVRNTPYLIPKFITINTSLF
jgi:hypothetical protein